MMPSRLPQIVGGTKYKHVSEYLTGGKTTVYKACIKKKGKINWYNYYYDMEVAAVEVDKQLIKAGFEPVNKLKRKIDKK